MPFVAWLALVSHAFPQHSAGPLVERVDHPAMWRSVIGGIAVAVQPGLERRAAAAADGGGDKQAIAPDDRTGVGEAGNRRAPGDVPARLAVPRIRQALPIGDAGCLGPSERGPTALRAR